jgi:hypothetical protein
MRGLLSRRMPAALVLGLYWFALTASAAAPLAPPPSMAAPTPVRAVSVMTQPVRCVGTLMYLRTNTLRIGGWPKLIVSLDITRADRCAGQYGQPVGRLHGFLVFTREKLTVRTYMRTGQPPSYLVQLCRVARQDCLDINAVIRWGPSSGRQ